MKKILLISLLVTSLFAEAKIYMGVGGGYTNESFSDSKISSSSAPMARVKIGYGDINAYAVEFSFDYLKNDTNVFSTTGEDSDKYALNIELVKAFDFDIFINPFFKAGFGAGYFTINHDEQSSIKYGSLNLGAGFFIPINEHLDIEVAYDYKYISYEKLTDSEGKILLDADSHLNGLYVGVNVRF